MNHPRTTTLAEVGEDAVLEAVLQGLEVGAASVGGVPHGELLIPAGDDAALLATSGSVVVTTDSMVRGLDWLDEWSRPDQVGAKLVVQNLADIAAMGAVPTGLVVALVADPGTHLEWVSALAEGIGRTASRYGVAVAGGDLSGAPAGTMVVAATALGDLRGLSPVRRSAAQPGQVVAVAGTLGRSGGGLAVLQQRGSEAGAFSSAEHELVRAHLTAAEPPLSAGPSAAAAGAGAMIDVSDGLVRDLGRVARASGVGIDLDEAALRTFVEGPLGAALGEREGLAHVLGGGEEHALVATFAPEALGAAGPHWRVIGRVLEGPARVLLRGQPVRAPGWDHFAGA